MREALDKTKKEEERKREKVTFLLYITCPSSYFTEMYDAVTLPLQLSIPYLQSKVTYCVFYAGSDMLSL